MTGSYIQGYDCLPSSSVVVYLQTHCWWQDTGHSGAAFWLVVPSVVCSCSGLWTLSWSSPASLWWSALWKGHSWILCNHPTVLITSRLFGLNAVPRVGWHHRGSISMSIWTSCRVFVVNGTIDSIVAQLKSSNQFHLSYIVLITIVIVSRPFPALRRLGPGRTIFIQEETFSRTSAQRGGPISLGPAMERDRGRGGRGAS